MRFKFQARHTRRHSPAALFSPRRRNWRKPKTDLMMPNTGSTVCFLSAYAARPVFVLSRCAMRSAAVAVSDKGAGSVKRSSAVEPSNVVFVPSHGNERLNTRLFAGHDILAAVESAVCQ